MQNMTLDDYAKSELIENNWMGEFCDIRFAARNIFIHS